jgi:hypothetical protein
MAAAFGKAASAAIRRLSPVIFDALRPIPRIGHSNVKQL